MCECSSIIDLLIKKGWDSETHKIPSKEDFEYCEKLLASLLDKGWNKDNIDLIPQVPSKDKVYSESVKDAWYHRCVRESIVMGLKQRDKIVALLKEKGYETENYDTIPNRQNYIDAANVRSKLFNKGWDAESLDKIPNRGPCKFLEETLGTEWDLNIRNLITDYKKSKDLCNTKDYFPTQKLIETLYLVSKGFGYEEACALSQVERECILEVYKKNIDLFH